MEQRNGYIWVPYTEWLGQNIPNPRYGISTPFPWFVNHYTPNQEATSYNDAVRLLRNIWNFHTYSAEGTGWGWIGYNTIQYGPYIFEGAGIGNRGIHAPGANGQSHGHAHLVSERNVTDEEWMALRAFVTDLVAWGVILPGVLDNSTYFTHHGDWISTTCSGPVKNTASHFYNVPAPEPPVEKEETMSDFRIRMAPGGEPAHTGDWVVPGNQGRFNDSGALDCFVKAGDTVACWLNGMSGSSLDVCYVDPSGSQNVQTVTWSTTGHATWTATATGKASIITWHEGVDYINAVTRG